MDEAALWRRHLHAHPETGFAEHATAAFVAERLEGFGLEVARGVGGTGVVGTLRGEARGEGRAIALRADMDALCQTEAASDRPWRSTVPGRMHACGHDGHTAALLAAARRLAARPDFSGTVHFLFQPAEEHGQGMQAMLDDGLLERFPFSEAYGFHNMPGLELGACVAPEGPVMAAEDNFEVTITGRGGHAARPHMVIDPIVAAAAVVLELQQIVARRLDPSEPAVVSVTEFTTNGLRNVIPDWARLSGDCRSFRPEVSAAIEAEMRRIALSVAAAHGAAAEVAYTRSFVPTVNAAAPIAAARRAARAALGTVTESCPRMMTSEDFARLLERVPGCFVFFGNGLESLPLHNAAFDFDDRLLEPIAAWAEALVRDRLGLDGGV